MFSIRKALFSDLETLVRFTEQEGKESEGENFDSQNVRRGVHDGLLAGYVDYFILEVQDVPVAAICVERTWSDWSADFYVSIAFVFVEEQHRRKGYFSKMLEFVERHYEGAELRLIHNKQNKRAKEAYLRRGFKDIPYESMSKRLEPRPTLWRVKEEQVLEVCCDNLASVHNAIKGGAQRIELCSALASGGLTPSMSVLRKTRDVFQGSLFAMVRPCEEFVVTEEHFLCMMEEVVTMRPFCDGLVFGCLDSDGEIDMRKTRALVECAQNRRTTFHRAFDLVPDQRRALDQLKQCGVDYVLTSAKASRAVEAVDEVASLSQYSASIGGPIVIAGSGINEDNVSLFLEKNVRHIHGSFGTRESGTLFAKPLLTNSQRVAATLAKMEVEK